MLAELKWHWGHEDIKHSIGNTVNNVVMTMYGVRWVLDLSEVIGSLPITVLYT